MLEVGGGDFYVKFVVLLFYDVYRKVDGDVEV